MNVTTLLVLTTLFISISDALPKTSYVKVDIWLIINLMILFFEIMLQSLMIICYKDTKHKDTKFFRVSPNNPCMKDNVDSRINGTHRTNEKNEKVLSLMRLLTRTALPGFYILFCIGFFLYGVIQASSEAVVL